MLEQLKKQHEEFVNQRAQAQVNFQQLTGAIYACEVMIKQCQNQGEMNNGEAQCSSEKQATCE